MDLLTICKTLCSFTALIIVVGEWEIEPLDVVDSNLVVT
jgi:hypothetical protein